MKKLSIIYTLIILASLHVMSQSKINIGAGYFGNTLVYPGLMVEGEMEFSATDVASIPLRISAGTYLQPRSHNGFFLDVGVGFRKYFRQGLFIEENIGIGVFDHFVHSDAAYRVEENGTVSETSRRMPASLMPSFTAGIGYDLTHGSGIRNLIWMRPKISWQYPVKNASIYSLALQVGYTHTISSRN